MKTQTEAMKSHIHHVKRLRAGSRLRYECLDCGKQLKILSGVIVEDVKAYEERKRADYARYLENLKAEGERQEFAQQQISDIRKDKEITATRAAELVAPLRAAGYAVILWTPEELKGANPTRVEDRSVELGWEIIADLQETV